VSLASLAFEGSTRVVDMRPANNDPIMTLGEVLWRHFGK
jgi:hypothetical protein